MFSYPIKDKSDGFSNIQSVVCKYFPILHFKFHLIKDYVNSVAFYAEPHSSVGSVTDLRTGGRWFDPGLDQYSFRGLMIVMSKNRSSLTVVHCFDNGYVGKQPVAWKNIMCSIG